MTEKELRHRQLRLILAFVRFGLDYAGPLRPLSERELVLLSSADAHDRGLWAEAHALDVELNDRGYEALQVLGELGANDDPGWFDRLTGINRARALKRSTNSAGSTRCRRRWRERSEAHGREGAPSVVSAS